jgi:hypothetical protein
MTIPAALYALAAIAVLSAGCATSDQTQPPAEEHELPEYRTGSSIPKRAPRPKTQEERAAEEAAQAQRNATAIVRPGG